MLILVVIGLYNKPRFCKGYISAFILHLINELGVKDAHSL